MGVMCVHGREQMCTAVCAHGKQKRISSVLIYHAPPYSFETGSVSEPEVRLVSNRFQQSFSLCPYSTEAPGECKQALLFTQCWDFELRSCAAKAITC